MNARRTIGRIDHHPILGRLPESPPIRFQFDGLELIGREGESIAAALLANGIRKLRSHEENGAPRGIYCNIGHCMECRLTVDGMGGIRACMTPIREGMSISSGERLPTPFRKAATPVGEAIS
ncbi:(2Fe-2S)-binding protein [Cohnella cholangitidis]|uniref:(2Fe-2S)-binding protein n=1 Tax=Cohnella cholangitidis TaxID=2598458 RepID=UPI001E49EEFD|nr:(2Fe-2S)-binding protein [Cohnella cholangitidis]